MEELNTTCCCCLTLDAVDDLALDLHIPTLTNGQLLMDSRELAAENLFPVQHRFCPVRGGQGGAYAL